MRFAELAIQTQRTAPSDMRTEGFAFLYRAGYLTRTGEPLPLGQRALERIHQHWMRVAAAYPATESFKAFGESLSLNLLAAADAPEFFFAVKSGDLDLLTCPACGYTSRREFAQARKNIFNTDVQRPLEKVLTPDCNTIAALAAYLNIPQEQTAKALMFTRVSDGQFIFVVVRGDMQASDAKLKRAFGDLRPATVDEIIYAGAVPGYASPIGLSNALIVVDELIPSSPNLVAGANEAGYHLLNTNCGRDYQPAHTLDVIQPKVGDACLNCSNPLEEREAILLAGSNGIDANNILLALAETHHDDKGLTLPKSVAPFDVYLMHVPGKTINTLAEAGKIHAQLEDAGFSVLFDDRDERAGVKFNDADLIGCPLRITAGEKALQTGMVEIKPRRSSENKLVGLGEITSWLD
jgi:prolyl-tRNA synthetase